MVEKAMRDSSSNKPAEKITKRARDTAQPNKGSKAFSMRFIKASLRSWPLLGCNGKKELHIMGM